MILTCPQCQSQYNLDPGKLGAGGRTVRCATCSHTWFQAVSPEEMEQSVTQKAEADFQAVLSEIGEGETVRAKESAAVAIAETVEDVSAAVMQVPGQAPSPPPVITHNPFGVGPGTFGLLTFFLCVSLTLLLLILGRYPMARNFPATALMYKAMGFHLEAPGEGLRLSEIVAEQQLEKEGRMLAVEGKMTNMSERGIAWPPLRVTLKNRQGETVKEWEIDSGVSVIASGETVPVALQLPDMPADGVSIDLRVRD